LRLRPLAFATFPVLTVTDWRLRRGLLCFLAVMTATRHTLHCLKIGGASKFLLSMGRIWRFDGAAGAANVPRCDAAAVLAARGTRPACLPRWRRRSRDIITKSRPLWSFYFWRISRGGGNGVEGAATWKEIQPASMNRFWHEDYLVNIFAISVFRLCIDICAHEPTLKPFLPLDKPDTTVINATHRIQFNVCHNEMKGWTSVEKATKKTGGHSIAPKTTSANAASASA